MEYGLKLHDLSDVKDMDAVIIAVAHDEFKTFTREDIDKFYSKPVNNRTLIDVKGLLDRKEYESLGYKYFRL